MLANHSGNTDNEYRVRCAVRQLIVWRKTWGLQKFREYIPKAKFEQRIWDLYYEQYKLGNSGKDGEWLSNGSLPQQALDI